MYHCVYSPSVKRIINSSLDSIELIKSELSIVKNDSRIHKKCGEKCKKRRLKVKSPHVLDSVQRTRDLLEQLLHMINLILDPL